MFDAHVMSLLQGRNDWVVSFVVELIKLLIDWLTDFMKDWLSE